MNRPLSSTIVVLATLSLSVVSVYTTAAGFNLYVPIPSLGWIASIAIQILIIFILFFTEFKNVTAYLLAMPTYLFLLAFSVGGSFLLIDKQLSLEDRQIQAARIIRLQSFQFLDQCSTYLTDRLTVINTLLARLQEYQATEDRIGVLSHEGSGKGPMYEEITARIALVSTIQRSLSTVTTELDTNCRTFLAKAPSELEANVAIIQYEKGLDCGAALLAKIPSDQTIQETLQKARRLFDRAKYQTFIPEMPTSVKPNRPVFQAASTTLQQRLQGAVDDLFRHSRFSTWVAAGLATLLELLLLFVALLSRFREQKPLGQELEILSNLQPKSTANN